MKINIVYSVVLLVMGSTAVPGFPSNPESEIVQQSSSQISENSVPSCCRNTLAGAINDFSFELMNYFRGRKNFFMSPLSIAVAMAMTYLGSGGQTKAQMEEVLQYSYHNLLESDVHEGFRQLITQLAHQNDDYKFYLANGMFLQDNFTVKPQYIQKLRDMYHGEIRNVNFASDSYGSINQINQWVATNTNNMIKKLFQEPLDPFTRLVLLNAVYFKGIWKKQFSRENTFEGNFYKTDGTTKSVQMMQFHEETFPYFEDHQIKYKFIKLPYKGESLSMLLALPLDFNAPANLMMSSELLCNINSKMEDKVLDVTIIPKFKMEHTEQLENVLFNLGMRDLFREGMANLTGIRSQNDLHVSSVVHKAVIDVNEEGSEAAAVSGVVIMTMSMSHNPQFVANRPFLFFIVDEINNLVLFSGRLADP